MRILPPLTCAVLLALGLAVPSAAQTAPSLGQAAAIAASTSDKSPGALLIAGNEGSWSLVSDGTDSRVVARLGWQSISGALAFGFESSASIQKNALDTELLNLDGLPGGDASITGQFSYRDFFERRVGREGSLLSVCEQVNLAIERQIRLDRGSLFVETLHGGACTLDALRDAGGPWLSEADKVELDAQAWACGELAKLNPDIVLTTPNTPLSGAEAPSQRFGKTGDCTSAAFIDAALKERMRREASAKDAAEAATKERAGLLERIAANDAALAATSDAKERERLAGERFDLASHLLAQEKIIAESESALKGNLPPLLMKPAETLAAKQAELLAAVCKRFDEPDRSAELVLVGRTSPRSNIAGC